MKVYRLGFIKNIKRGFLIIPCGLIMLGFIFITLSINMDFLLKILIITLFGFMGLPGMLIHFYYIVHDINVKISYKKNNDFFEFYKNGQTTNIFKSDIESIIKINRDMRFVLWSGYMMFKIRLRNGNVYSITNLSIEFDDLYELSRIKGRQLKIIDKFRLI